ncbi:MAG: hypothetical protein PHW00_05640 [Clostridia bacterium]|nr:hypothetical protein [Clostridia bacterium]MDD3832118.1 hypothetical protein [Clostridia bacterium]
MKINVTYVNDEGKSKKIKLAIPLLLLASGLGSRLLSKAINKRPNTANEQAVRTKLEQKKDKLRELGIDIEGITDNLSANTTNVCANGQSTGCLTDTQTTENLQPNADEAVSNVKSVLDEILSIDADGKPTTIDNIGDALNNSDCVDIKLKPKQVANLISKHIDSEDNSTDDDANGSCKKYNGERLNGQLAKLELTPSEIRTILSRTIKEMRKYKGVTILDVQSAHDKASVVITI